MFRTWKELWQVYARLAKKRLEQRLCHPVPKAAINISS
jgi:hypothetical protein